MRSRKAPARKRGKKEKESISFVNDHGRKKEMLGKMKIAAFALESGSIKTSLKKRSRFYRPGFDRVSREGTRVCQ